MSDYEDNHLDQTGLPIRGQMRQASGVCWIAERILWKPYDYAYNCGRIASEIHRLLDMHNRLAQECNGRYPAQSERHVAELAVGSPEE